MDQQEISDITFWNQSILNGEAEKTLQFQYIAIDSKNGKISFDSPCG